VAGEETIEAKSLAATVRDLFDEGLTGAEIARRLGINEKKVSRMKRKLVGKTNPAPVSRHDYKSEINRLLSVRDRARLWVSLARSKNPLVAAKALEQIDEITEATSGGTPNIVPIFAPPSDSPWGKK